jgi:hypothetical protein
MHAACSGDDWGCKTYVDHGSYQDVVWRKFWVSYFLDVKLLMYLYLALLDKFSCLIVYMNFIVCLRVFPSRWLLWSSTIQLEKWSKTPSNMPGSSLLPTTIGMC